MASALARLCSRAWRQQHQHHLQQHHRLAASIVLAAPRPPPPSQSTTNGFHTSCATLMGRKGGASALEKRQPPSAFRAKAARQKRLQQQEQEKKRRQLQQRQKRAHPGNRGVVGGLPAIADPAHLLDPDFGDLLHEILRPVEDTSAPPSPPDRFGKPRVDDPFLLEDGMESKEALLAGMDVEGKRDEMVAKEAETGKACPPEEYDRLLRAFGVQDRPDAAVALLREMQDRGRPITPKTLTSVVYALCRATQPRPEEAEALMMELEAGGVAAPDAWTWTTLIRGYVRARRAGAALEAFRKMKLAGHQQDLAVCTAVMEALGKHALSPSSPPSTTTTTTASSFPSKKAIATRADRVLDFWMDMRLHGLEPDAVAYTVLMKTLVRTGDVERALSLLDEMEQMNVQPTIVTYNTLLLAAAEAPLWFPGYNRYVFEILGRLESAHLAPNTETYRSLLRLCAQAGNPLLAERYLEQMQGELGLEPGREHYHALLRAYATAQSAGCKGGRIPKLHGVADGDKSGGITSIAGRALGPGGKDVEIDLKAAKRALLPAKASKKRAAALLLKEAEAARVSLEAGEEVGVGKKKVVDPSSLLLSVEGEEEVGGQPTAAALALAWAGAEASLIAGDEGEEGAVVLRGGLLHRLPSERERLRLDGLLPFEGETETDLVRSRLPQGIRVSELQEANISAAHAVLREMRERGLEPTTETMNRVLAVYAEGLRIRRALQLVDSQFSTPTQKRTPSFSSPSEEEARKALMLKTGMEGLAPVPADGKTYETVVRMLVRASRMGEAFQLVKRLREETGIAPSPDTLGVMVEALGRRGEVKPALHLLEVMREDLGYEPKEWHVRPLRRAMQRRGLRHPLVPADPKSWLKEGLLRRKKPDKAGRRVRNLVASQMRAGS